MTEARAQVLVLGGGPGGYVAAIRAGQLGLDTVLVEADTAGGTCLLRGCIPSKALIHAAGAYADITAKLGPGAMGISLPAPPVLDFAETIRWKDSVVGRLTGGVAVLLKRARVRVVSGSGRFVDPHRCEVATADGPLTIVAEQVILATGSLPAALLGLPFGGPVISSTEALALEDLPARLAVIGAGYIGLELGIAFRKLGSEVTIIEAREDILPIYDAELVAPVRKWLQTHGVRLLLGARVHGFAAGALHVQTGAGEQHLPADLVLQTVGRLPLTEGWGLAELGLTMAGRFVQVDAECRTSRPHIFAIGDLVGEPMLAHKASAQGEMVAEIIAGARRAFDPVAIPAICFTDPEIISVGLLPRDAPADAITAQFPFAANGRALSMQSSEGFVRIVAGHDDHRVLGIQAVGAHVAELCGEFVQALEMGALLEDIAGTIHAHPTLGEAFHEASLRGLGHAIHV